MTNAKNPSSLIGTPMLSMILSGEGGYTALVWFNAAIYLVVTIVFLVARVMSVGWSVRAIF